MANKPSGMVNFHLLDGFRSLVLVGWSRAPYSAIDGSCFNAATRGTKYDVIDLAYHHSAPPDDPLDQQQATRQVHRSLSVP
ncbi:hypothetical protein MJO28_007919 [Puccinia striiformis f. sp. tritici]|uniref:Uncharacterized protein n=1 Tax=Puccinia striiformis f. sp. tritici TaxID=168172 RepID=A0ACC0EAC4_9BASI|nr:hypothetical protein MJO28_007919 [Puccinia striiformis f. sp. tritici]KAI7952235.1 hypothetical protein MJO29_007866 [Puccinia striiformis f. sp. tritici]